ncbi:MAG TPA: HAD family hydrolase [Candidatus Babeliales bacterium]|nr:HAD family hydrolase [Candidatus Babeliales bacterium]
MKTTYKSVVLFIGILCSTVGLSALTLTPENTVLIFDLDDVVIQKTFLHKLNIVFGGIKKDTFNAISYLNALWNIKKEYKKDADGIKESLCDTNGNAINGLTFHFLYHAVRNPQLADYVAWLVETMENSRCFIDGTKKILDYLKAKNYEIVFATNKDRISYDMTAKAFGADFTDIPTKIFVAHPGNDESTITQIKDFANEPTTPSSYKEFAKKTLTVCPTNIIFHAPSKKPELAYYHYVAQVVNVDKNMIFVDDKKTNSEGFNTLQESTDRLRQGIHFKDPLQLANELVQCNILSETTDSMFLDEIRYPGIIGKIRLYIKKLKSNREHTIPASSL